MEQSEGEFDERLRRLEELFEAHVEVCAENKKEFKQIMEVIENLHTSMKVANFMRNAFVWVAGLVASGIALYKSWKGL